MTNAAFVPLLAGGRIATDSLGAGAKAPLSSGPAFESASTSLHSAPPPEPVPHQAHGQPWITLEKQGETITHIRVECPCGQVIELKCDY